MTDDLISRQKAIDDEQKLINKEQAIDKIKKRLFETAFNNVGIKQNIDETLVDVAENRLENWFNELPSIQPVQRWVPCSERLPEKEGWYITTVESEKTGKRRIENDLFAVDIALAHGHTPNKFCKDGYRQRTVAWMPFPEPYQERGEQ